MIDPPTHPFLVPTLWSFFIQRKPLKLQNPGDGSSVLDTFSNTRGRFSCFAFYEQVFWKLFQRGSRLILTYPLACMSELQRNYLKLHQLKKISNLRNFKWTNWNRKLLETVDVRQLIDFCVRRISGNVDLGFGLRVHDLHLEGLALLRPEVVVHRVRAHAQLYVWLFG